MADVFLSYAREDKQTAQRLADAIEARGFSVWWDAEIPPGKTWDQMIEQELSGTRCALVLWSKTSVGKTWVRAEASEALKRGILIPVLIDAVEPPIAFRLTQAASLVGWRGEDDHPGFRQILGAVGRLVRDPSVAPKAALRAAGPDQQPSPKSRAETTGGAAGLPSGSARWRRPALAAFAGAGVAALIVFFVLAPAEKNAQPERAAAPAELNGRARVPARQGDIPGRYPFTSQRLVTADELENASPWDLKIMRNEIFARHGYVFKTDDMKRYFSQQAWYRPLSDDVLNSLSPIELANVETIKAVENRR